MDELKKEIQQVHRWREFGWEWWYRLTCHRHSFLELFFGEEGEAEPLVYSCSCGERRAIKEYNTIDKLTKVTDFPEAGSLYKDLQGNNYFLSPTRRG